MPHIKQVIRQTAMSLTEIADAAGLSHGTVSKLVNNKPVSELSLSKVLRVVNQRVGTSYDVPDIQGVNLTGGD